jgi:hypothetical protein
MNVGAELAKLTTTDGVTKASATEQQGREFLTRLTLLPVCAEARTLI